MGQTQYEWHFTQHVKKRWQSRMKKPLDELEYHLDRSQKINARLRKYLILTTKSVRHQRCLQKGSGYFYRVSGNAVFVLKNLHVITVFPKPTGIAAVVRADKERRKAAQMK